MNSNKPIGKVMVSTALVAAMAVGVITLFESRAQATPRPLCGWSAIWDCTMPDGSHRLVGGTRCDINAFERQTGAHCVLWSGG